MKHLATIIILITTVSILTACSKSIADTEETPDSTLPLEDTKWILTSINGESVIGDAEITTILIAGEISGFSGCNSYHGNYTFDGENLSMDGPMMSTMMACAEPDHMNQETTFMGILQAVNGFSIESNTLTLTTETDDTLTFVAK